MEHLESERWREVEEAFHEALACTPEVRAAFLRRLADKDPTVHREVCSLLEGHESEGFLDRVDGRPDRDQAQLERVTKALADRYVVLSEAGQGGMATVYRARDLKHDRSVAIKVLRPYLVHSVGVDRFLAEIETTAGLQHPHILPLFDSDEIDGLLYFVMPFVEGETLSERVEREGQLPVEDAVRIAARMAEALDYAHRRGVIHRDIKPGNVLLQDGQPTISDFGISLALGAAGDDRLTRPGYVLGTPRFMSPEQITNEHEVGPAADIYALGCVLHLMLVGETPFGGRSIDSVQRKLESGPVPSPRTLRRSIPRNVDAAIRKSLERLPADRFRTAKDFADALTDPSFRYGDEAEAAVSSRWRTTSLVLAGLLVLATALLVSSVTRPDTPATVQRFSVTPRGQGEMLDSYVGVNVALSPEGDRLVYVGQGPQGQQLWIRRLDELDPTPIRWTDGAENPVFSPDGTSVAFRAGDDLRTVSLLGGLPDVLLEEGVTGRYIDWGDDGYIYFASDSTISRIPGDGGSPEPVTLRFEGARTRIPRALPAGGGLLVTLRRDAAAQATIGSVPPGGGEVRELLPGVSARYLTSGHLVYATPDGSLMAIRFDPDRLETRGEAAKLLDDLDVRLPGLGAQYALSRDGTLLYRTAASTDVHRPVWVDRTGGTSPVDPEWTFRADMDDSSLALSPDGRLLLVSLPRDAGGGWDLWSKSLEDGELVRITTEGIENRRPSWSADGAWITYIHVGSAGDEIRRRPARGGPPSALSTGLAGARPASEALVSASGEWLVFRTGSTDDASNPDIFRLRIGADSTAHPLVAGEHVEWAPTLSPDDGWLAYSSQESGRSEVYVRSFLDMDRPPVRVSSTGGDNPVWSKSGGVLYYRDAADQLVEVEIEVGADLQVLRRTVLFSAMPYLRGDGHPMYDVHPDGDRFLMLQEVSSDASSELVLVRNWTQEVERVVPR